MGLAIRHVHRWHKLVILEVVGALTVFTMLDPENVHISVLQTVLKIAVRLEHPLVLLTTCYQISKTLWCINPKEK